MSAGGEGGSKDNFEAWVFPSYLCAVLETKVTELV